MLSGNEAPLTSRAFGTSNVSTNLVDVLIVVCRESDAMLEAFCSPLYCRRGHHVVPTARQECCSQDRPRRSGRRPRYRSLRRSLQLRVGNSSYRSLTISTQWSVVVTDCQSRVSVALVADTRKLRSNDSSSKYDETT